MPQYLMNYRKFSVAPLLRVALGAALSAFVVCANTAARAGDDSSDTPSLGDKIMRTLGLMPSENPINYSERSPLVVPPTRDLPPPAADAAPKIPDWPKDPDVKRREKAKAAEKVVPHGDYASEADRVLRPDELDPPGRVAPPSHGSQQDQATGTVPPPKKSIFSFSWLKQEEYCAFYRRAGTNQPDRSASRLSHPVAGPAVWHPAEHKKAKPQTVGERMELQR